ncbi:MAG: IPT/TIG domain-containing protein, partial [Deltaproteobacteria bacterium]|nr:IPT/TIG domain-containing protein [Deltaproteobacteria bacterium]
MSFLINKESLRYKHIKRGGMVKKYSVLVLSLLFLGLNLVYAGNEPSVSFIDPPLNFHTPGTELMLAGSNFDNVEQVFYNKVEMLGCRIVHDGMIDQCIIPSGATIPESSDDNKLITFKVKAPPPPSSGGVTAPPPKVEIKAFPLKPAQEKQISKKSLEEVFIEEVKKYPGLQAFFRDEAQKPFQYALKALQEKRHVEKFPQTHPIGRKNALKSWLKENKEWYLSYAGINEFMNKVTPPADKKPVITNIHPDTIREDFEFYIFGENFDQSVNVYYNNTLMQCKYRSPTEIECYTPKALSDDGTIKVVTSDGEAIYSKKLIAFAEPQIDSIEEDPKHSGIKDIYTGDTIRIKGNHFLGSSEVLFGSHKVQSIQVVSRYVIHVPVPNITGTFTLKVKTAKGEATKNVEIKGRPVPTLTSVPSEMGPDIDFKIQGKNFTHGMKVMLLSGTKVVASPDVKPTSQQEAEVRAPKEVGTYTLKIETAYGEAIWPSPIKIKKTPIITSISPEGNQLGNPVVIEGKYFEDIESITVGGENIPSNEYSVNKEKTKITLTTVSWGIGRLSLAFANVTLKTKWGETYKPIISPKESVTYNAEGHEEKCFPAVGNGCKGGGQEETKEKAQILWLAGGC